MSNSNCAQLSTPTYTMAWSDLEEAFFASAPPDEPEPSAEPSSFDDLLEGPAPRRGLGALRRLVAATAARGPRRTVAIVLAAIALLLGLGLSAAVLAAISTT